MVSVSTEIINAKLRNQQRLNAFTTCKTDTWHSQIMSIEDSIQKLYNNHTHEEHDTNNNNEKDMHIANGFYAHSSEHDSYRDCLAKARVKTKSEMKKEKEKAKLKSEPQAKDLKIGSRDTFFCSSCFSFVWLDCLDPIAFCRAPFSRAYYFEGFHCNRSSYDVKRNKKISQHKQIDMVTHIMNHPKTVDGNFAYHAHCTATSKIIAPDSFCILTVVL